MAGPGAETVDSRARLGRAAVAAGLLGVFLAVGAVGVYRYARGFWLYRGFPPPNDPAFVSAKGSAERIYVASAALGGRSQPVDVYLPPGYSASTRRRYPVLKKMSISARNMLPASTAGCSLAACCDSSRAASVNATKSKPINPAEAPVLAVKKRAYWSSMRGPSLESGSQTATRKPHQLGTHPAVSPARLDRATDSGVEAHTLSQIGLADAAGMAEIVRNLDYANFKDEVARRDSSRAHVTAKSGASLGELQPGGPYGA